MPSEVPIDSVRKREEWTPVRSVIDRLPPAACPEHFGGGRESEQKPTPPRHIALAIRLPGQAVAACHGQPLTTEIPKAACNLVEAPALRAFRPGVALRGTVA